MGVLGAGRDSVGQKGICTGRKVNTLSDPFWPPSREHKSKWSSGSTEETTTAPFKMNLK
jgi:hypothetical protein